jgi:two-component system, OmpR family, sensor histidine kinase QseC
VGNWDRSRRLKSLRGRLWLGLSVTVIVFWCLIFTVGFLTAGTDAAPWDASLERFAQLLLAGLPSTNSSNLYSPTIEASEPPSPAVASLRPNEATFQIWRNRRLIMRSRNAPNIPLKPDFRQGIADQAVGEDIWRVYDLADATGTTHVQVGRSPHDRRAEILHVASVWVTVTTLLLALPGAAVWLVIRWSFVPVDAMRDLMEQRKPFDLMPLRHEKLPSEVQTLVDSFNRILEQLNSAIQGERRFIADAAHELRTPLALLAANAQVALRADTRQEREAALRRLCTGVERSTRLSEQLLDLAQLDSSDHVTAHPTVNISDLVMMVVRDYETTARQNDQSITLHAESATTCGNLDELGILLRNLLDNALRYSGAGSHVAVSCVNTVRAGTACVRVTVEDDGPGVPQEYRERIFDRFYRIAGSGQTGSGIGLSLVARIVASHHAQIEVGPGPDNSGFHVAVYFARL